MKCNQHVCREAVTAAVVEILRVPKQCGLNACRTNSNAAWSADAYAYGKVKRQGISPCIMWLVAIAGLIICGPRNCLLRYLICEAVAGCEGPWGKSEGINALIGKYLQMVVHCTS